SRIEGQRAGGLVERTEKRQELILNRSCQRRVHERWTLPLCRQTVDRQHSAIFEGLHLHQPLAEFVSSSATGGRQSGTLFSSHDYLMGGRQVDKSLQRESR